MLLQEAEHAPDTDVFRQTAVNKLLHLSPRHLVRHADCGTARSTSQVHITDELLTRSDSLAVDAPPLLRELLLRSDVLDRDREVDQEEVKVLKTPKGKRVLAALLNLSLAVSQRIRR